MSHFQLAARRGKQKDRDFQLQGIWNLALMRLFVHQPKTNFSAARETRQFNSI